MATYGYIPDPLTKTFASGVQVDLLAADRQYTTGLRPYLLDGAPGDVDLSRFCISMDQLSLSSCVGNGTVEALEILNNIAGYNPVPLSRLFVYAMARNEEEDQENPGHTRLERDEGTHIRDAFDVLSRFGVCDEYIWPYDEQQVNTSPSLKAQRQALGHKIHSYYRITETGQDRVDAIVEALRQQHPVVFGTQITGAFQSLQGAGPVDVPTGATVGGHCMVVVGYVNGKLKIKNSWGDRWGDGGFCYFTPDYLAWSGTSDLWVASLGLDFSP